MPPGMAKNGLSNMQDLRCYFAESNHSVLTPGTLEVPSQNISGLSGMFLQLKRLGTARPALELSLLVYLLLCLLSVPLALSDDKNMPPPPIRKFGFQISVPERCYVNQSRQPGRKAAYPFPAF
ncbi:hypothetical protein H671_2g4802 [Cricetulus griseus]|nr:hypothetical protein H671_2g4802 [Cricetulus griseus]